MSGCVAVPPMFSLPLMGIRNLAAQDELPSECGHLITPHGDQELGPGGAAEDEALIELITPHGDQEQDDGGRVIGPDVRLITPHGDQEHRDWRHFLQHRTLLITPHGDQELHGAGRNDRPTQGLITPSWGSGTGKLAGGQRVRWTSLPLMGIRNPLLF